MKSTKDKIHEILGIGPDQSVDDVFNSLSADLHKAEQVMENIDDSIASDLAKVDKQLGISKDDSSKAGLALADLQSSMKEIEDLITLSKQMYIHIHEGIMSSELIDSELIQAASKFLESMHINIAEFISLYRDKQKFIEKVKLMAYAQEQKKELMQMKFDLDIKKMKEKDKADAVDVEGHPTGSFSFTVEDVTKALQNLEENGKSIEEVIGIPEVKIPTDESSEKSDANESDE